MLMSNAHIQIMYPVRATIERMRALPRFTRSSLLTCLIWKMIIVEAGVVHIT